MKIPVDAMGGDHAPVAIVRGAVRAAVEGLAEIILVGDASAIEKELKALPATKNLECELLLGPSRGPGKKPYICL